MFGDSGRVVESQGTLNNLGFACSMLGKSSKHIIPNGGKFHGNLPS